MTRDTHVIEIIETRTNKGPSPIGFLPTYLPNSSKEIGTKLDQKDPPPYPVDSSSSGTFPIPCYISIPTDTRNNVSDVPPNEISTAFNVSPSAPKFLNKGLTNLESQEIEKTLSNLENKVLCKSDREIREFLKEQHEVVTKIDSIKCSLSAEEQKDFDQRLRKIDEIRRKNGKDEGEKLTDEEIDRKNSSDDSNERNTKCAFDISSLLPKFPQLVVDIVICVKGAMKGLTTVSGGTYFTISLSAALFTAYYLILFCTCRQTKRTRMSEFLHSLVYTIVFLIVSFFCTEDEQLRAFGFLASVPYGSEVCWKCWNFLFKKKFQSSTG